MRSLDNALHIDATNKITEDTGFTNIPKNGILLRNLIHGADTVMSHITHFYALAALDYVDTLNPTNLGAPFTPEYDSSPSSLLPSNTGTLNGATLLDNYVQSLVMRRKAHTMGAIFSGRQPIQNAIVPGGVTTLPTGSDIEKFSGLLNDIRGFINTAYIPDVITVATMTSPVDYTPFWNVGGNPGNLLSYGEYPLDTGAETLLFKRGLWVGGASGNLQHETLGPRALADKIVEYVDAGYYTNYASGPNTSKNPFAGETNPDVSQVTPNTSISTKYSWLKAPRCLDESDAPTVCEVGPLARVWMTVQASATETVSGAGASQTIASVIPGLAAVDGVYDLATMVNAVVAAYVPGNDINLLLSLLGRHAGRVLECKFLADAMADTNAGDVHWLTDLKNDLTGDVYVYAKLPTRPAQGAGLAEAPRGALGHWITIEKKRIVGYQCVVPTTWNHSPRDGAGNRGAAEEALSTIGSASVYGTTVDEMILNAVRLLHTYDFCIACAVHFVRPDGSTIAKFKMDTDGRVTKLPHDAEI